MMISRLAGCIVRVPVIITCLGYDLTDSHYRHIVTRTLREESCEFAKRYGSSRHIVFSENVFRRIRCDAVCVY